MLGLLQLFTVCATLVQCSFAAPWDTNNNIREFDIEWQCEQFCNRLKGHLSYNITDSSCICTVDTTDKIEFDSRHLEHKLHDLGFNFKIIDKTKLNKVKRETVADKIKKNLAERSQIGNPLEAKNEIIQNAGPDPQIEDKEKITLSEKFHRLRSKLLPKIEKDNGIITAPDNFVLGKAALNVETKNNEETVKEETPKDKLLKFSSNLKAPKNESPDIKDNVIVGQAAPQERPEKETENVDNKSPETPANERLNQLRLKLAALKSSRLAQEPKHTDPDEDDESKGPPSAGIKKLQQLHLRTTLLGNAQPTNNEEKPISERIKDIRERLRMRLQSRLKANKPNEDGHIEENSLS